MEYCLIVWQYLSDCDTQRRIHASTIICLTPVRWQLIIRNSIELLSIKAHLGLKSRRPREVSKTWYSGLDFSNRSEIWLTVKFLGDTIIITYNLAASWDFTRFDCKFSYRLLNRGPDWLFIMLWLIFGNGASFTLKTALCLVYGWETLFT